MEGQPVFTSGGKTVGTAEIRQEGGYRLISASVSDSEPGIRKLWRTGAPPLLLGTLCPDNGMWRLKRRISLRQWQLGETPDSRLMVCKPDGLPLANVELPAEPEDPILREILSQAAPACGQGTDTLRWSWRPGEPVPAAGVFTFLRWDGGGLVLCLHGGRPWAGTVAPGREM